MTYHVITHHHFFHYFFTFCLTSDTIFMRTIIDLPDYQIEALRLIEVRKNVSRAELVRQAIAQYVVQYAESPDAFGAWKAKTPAQKKAKDGVTIQRKLRAEWDR